MNSPSQKKKYLLIGTGALGGFYGAKLSNAGFDVHFLVRSDYYYVKKHGLKVLSPSGDLVLNPIQCYNNPVDMPQGDIILIATKAFSNKELPEILKPLLKDSSRLVLLQNGLGGEEYLADFMDPARIFGGLSILAVSKDGPGLIHHHDFGSIKIGQYNANNLPMAISPALLELVHDFRVAGVSSSAVPDLMQARWEKLVWNIPFSGLSVILNADTHKIISNQNSLKLAHETIIDVANAALACGKQITTGFQQQMVDITVKMTPYFPSMKLDYNSGKEMEIEAIFGNPLIAAQKAGYIAHYISALYNILKYMEKERSSPTSKRTTKPTSP